MQQQQNDLHNQTMQYERGSLEKLQSADVRLPPQQQSNQQRRVVNERSRVNVGQGLNPNATQTINMRSDLARDQLNHSVNLG